MTEAPAVPTSIPSSAPSAEPSVAAVKLDSNKKFGMLLVTTDGNTLYTFSKDTPDVSNCTDSACVAFWPPYTIHGTPAAIKGLPGKLGTITLADGTSQLTYNDMPLYTFAIDKNPGDVNGDSLNDFGGIWHVVVTAPAQSAAKHKPRKITGGGYRPKPRPMYP
jgi:predicted lipoprotein with Yx(FWY)xxD motif